LHNSSLPSVCGAMPGACTWRRSTGTGNVGSEVNTPLTTMLAHADESSSTCTEQLARFFPDARPFQVRAVITPMRAGADQVRESVVVEFASAEKAIFSSRSPLEFDDRVRISDAKGNAECVAAVVAVQYHDGRKAVAVQFADKQIFWVKKRQ
jgi:hypothetical protein